MNPGDIPTSRLPETRGGAGENPRFEPLVAATQAEACAIKLPIFEGPLDLLLYLIRQNEVDITDIPISEIGQQYLEYLEVMRQLNLDLAGEYLLMAATLAWIKSRLLLPLSGDEGEEEIDPRAELVARLLEFQRFKEAATTLDGNPRLGRDVFCAVPGALPCEMMEERAIEADLLALVEAFRRVLAEAQAAEAIRDLSVESETITVREQMFAIMERLQDDSAFEFEELLRTGAGRPLTRPLVVASFLALLELVRIAALHIYQGLGNDGAPEGVIRVRRNVDLAVSAWTERLAEIL